MPNAGGSGQVRLAIVGCGAVTQLYHLPAARRSPRVQVTCLVDRDLALARRLARRFGVRYATADYLEAVGHADGAIVATPNRLHASMCGDLLRRGLHVLCEKPLALEPDEAQRVVKEAKLLGRVLAVGHIRRFFPSTRLVRELIDSRLLGEVVEFAAEEGQPFGWPSRTSSYLEAQQAGGGVLVDWGSHAIDRLLAWLGQEAVLEEYRDNNLGGVESDCLLKMRIKRPGGRLVLGALELSRTRALANVAFLRCERGGIRAPLMGDSPVLLQMIGSGGPVELAAFLPGGPAEKPVAECFLDQLENFVDAVLGIAPPQVPGEAVLPTITLIHQCYGQRQPLPEPWAAPLERGLSPGVGEVVRR